MTTPFKWLKGLDILTSKRDIINDYVYKAPWSTKCILSFKKFFKDIKWMTEFSHKQVLLLGPENPTILYKPPWYLKYMLRFRHFVAKLCSDRETINYYKRFPENCKYVSPSEEEMIL